jgi:hypothetical protein
MKRCDLEKSSVLLYSLGSERKFRCVSVQSAAALSFKWAYIPWRLLLKQPESEGTANGNKRENRANPTMRDEG